MTTMTIREHKIETYVRIAFDEPVQGEGHEITSAVVTTATWVIDDQEGPSDEPYVTFNFYGYPLTDKGKRDGRNKRPVVIPSCYVPAELRDAVLAKS